MAFDKVASPAHAVHAREAIGSNAKHRDSERDLTTAGARRSPVFCIVDADGNVLLSRTSAQPAETALLSDVRACAARMIRATNGGSDRKLRPDLMVVRPGLVARLVELTDGRRISYAVFVEAFQQRDLLKGAAKRYELTPRELEVLDLIMTGETTAAIAGELCIGETTVHQHVRNIGVKFGVSTRKAIVGSVLRAL